MKKNFLRIAICFGFIATTLSCAKTTICESNPSGIKFSLKGEVDNENAKTSLGEDLSIIWSTTDKVKVGFTTDAGETSTVCTATDITADGRIATFTGVVEEAPTSSSVIAVYPSSACSKMSYENKTATITIPTVQKAVAGSFADGANVATSFAAYDGKSEPVMQFKNVGGLIGFTVDGGEKQIQTIKIIALTKPLAGTLEATIGENGVAETKTKSYSNIITLEGPFVNGSKYYAVALPNNYENGFALEFIATDGRKAALSNVTPYVLDRNGNVNLGSFTISSWTKYLWSAAWITDCWRSGTTKDTDSYTADGLTLVKNAETTTPRCSFVSDAGGFYVATNATISFNVTKPGTLTVIGHGSTNGAVTIQTSTDGQTFSDSGQLLSTNTQMRTTLTKTFSTNPGTVYLRGKANGTAYIYSIKWDEKDSDPNKLIMDMNWVESWKEADAANWNGATFKGSAYNDGNGIAYDNTSGYAAKPTAGYTCQTKNLPNTSYGPVLAAGGTFKFAPTFSGEVKIIIKGFGASASSATSMYYKVNEGGTWKRPWPAEESGKFRFSGWGDNANPVLSVKETPAFTIESGDEIWLSGASPTSTYYEAVIIEKVIE